MLRGIYLSHFRVPDNNNIIGWSYRGWQQKICTWFLHILTNKSYYMFRDLYQHLVYNWKRRRTKQPNHWILKLYPPPRRGAGGWGENIKNTWKTTRCSKLQKSTTRYRWELPFFKLSRSLIFSIVLNVRRSSQSTRGIWPRSYLFPSFSNRSNSPRSCLGT